MMIQTQSTDTERAADRLREAAARLEREAEFLDMFGQTLAPDAPRSAVLRGLLVQAEQLDAITMLLEGGDSLEVAIADVMGQRRTLDAAKAA